MIVVVRAILTKMIWLTELPPSFLAVVSAYSLTIGWVSTLSNESWSIYVSSISYILSVLVLFPIILKDINIWRLFPVEYDGVESVMKYINENSEIRNNLFWGSDNRLRVDAEGLLRCALPLLDRVSFVGGDEELQKICGDINFSSFEGSRYGLSYERKLKRNKEISEKNQTTFAILFDEYRAKTLGLSAVIPLSVTGAASYTAGQISDNDLHKEMVALPGDHIGAIVFFMIAHDKRGKDSGKKSPLSPKILGNLIEISLIQAVLSALGNPIQKRYIVLAANSNPKLKKLFLNLKLSERPDLKSADQEVVFSNQLHIRNIGAAIRLLRSNRPDILEMIR